MKLTFHYFNLKKIYFHYIICSVSLFGFVVILKHLKHFENEMA